MKLRFEIGRKLFRQFLSKVLFLSTGVTWAILKESGTVPVDMDIFTIFVITGMSSAEQCLTSHVGTGSNIQDLDGELMIILCISSSVAWGKFSRKEAGESSGRQMDGRVTLGEFNVEQSSEILWVLLIHCLHLQVGCQFQLCLQNRSWRSVSHK